MKQGKLFVFSAPSGSGKTTLVRHLLTQKIPLGFSISATSREVRGAEIEGIDYYYCSSEKFSSMIKNQELYEYKEFRGWFYGTSLKEFNSAEIFIMSPSERSCALLCNFDISAGR